MEDTLDYKLLNQLNDLFKYAIENKQIIDWLTDEQRQHLLEDDDQPSFIEPERVKNFTYDIDSVNERYELLKNGTNFYPIKPFYKHISMVTLSWYKLGRFPLKMDSVYGLNEVLEDIQSFKEWESLFLNNLNLLFKEFNSLFNVNSKNGEQEYEKEREKDKEEVNNEEKNTIVIEHSNDVAKPTPTPSTTIDTSNIGEELKITINSTPTSTLDTATTAVEIVEKVSNVEEEVLDQAKEQQVVDIKEEDGCIKINQILLKKFYELVINQLSLDRLLKMLALRRTVGSVKDIIPPGPIRMINSANLPHKPGTAAKLSVSARAFCKHSNRSENSFWGSGTGKESAKNERSEKTIVKILRDSLWINMHGLPHEIVILEVRCSESYGLRWDSSGTFFRGTLEPMMEDGHLNGWKH